MKCMVKVDGRMVKRTVKRAIMFEVFVLFCTFYLLRFESQGLMTSLMTAM